MKQTTLDAPGMRPTHHRDVSEAAEAFADAKQAAKRASDKAKELGEALIVRMKKRKLNAYVDRGLGLFVTLENEDKVRVKRSSPDGNEEES